MSDLTAAEIRELFERELADAGGVRAFARRTGLSPTYVSRVRTGKEPISGRLLAHLGVERVVVYRRRARGES